MAKNSSSFFCKRISLAFLLIGSLSLGNLNGACGRRLGNSGESSTWTTPNVPQKYESNEDTVPTSLPPLFQTTKMDGDGQLIFTPDMGAPSEEDVNVRSPDITLDLNVLSDRNTTDWDDFMMTMNSSSTEFERPEYKYGDADPLNLDVSESNITEALTWNNSVIVVDAKPRNGVLLTSNILEQNVQVRRLREELQTMKGTVEGLVNIIHEANKIIGELHSENFELTVENSELKEMGCGQTNLENTDKPVQLEKVKNNGTLNSLNWGLDNFVKVDRVNPILGPQNNSLFWCPKRNKIIAWQKQGAYNPAAIIKDHKVYLLFRGEDDYGTLEGTSRIGLAVSSDGFNFVQQNKPVLYPDNDFLEYHEWVGGCENPRIVEDEKGTYILLYNGYGEILPKLLVATSKDLRKWKKHGLAFRNLDWSTKNGAVVTSLDPTSGKFIPTKVNGKYWMYWHANYDIYAATSDNLIDWTPLTNSPVMSPRPGHFDSHKVEPGPQAVVRDDGILLIYNGINNSPAVGLPVNSISIGQALFSLTNPAQLLARMEDPLIKPERGFELEGKTRNVVFAEGLVYFNNKWMLYYGAADSRIGVATSG